MSFTGRLGTPGSRLGYIALGTSYLPGGPNAFDFGVHQLTADQVRVYYNKPLTDTALEISNYTLISLAPPGTAVVPNIDEITYFDDGRTAIILYLDKALTSGTDYSLQINDVIAVDGEIVPPGGKNFTANVIDYPLVLGAWQSKRDAVDILFDRSVGPTSTTATFEIRDASAPGPGVAMTQLAWAGENIPETTLRVQLPPGMPAADAYEIDYSGVEDESLNSLDDTVPLTLALRSSPPYSYTELRQLQITDAFVVEVDTEFQVGTVRVYFNGPVLDATTTVNWAAYQSHEHLKTDDSSEITAPNAFDITSLINLANDAKAKFNAHRIRYGVHVTNDIVNIISTPNAFDIVTAYTLINDIQTQYIAHLAQLHVHLYEDKLHNDINYLNVSGNYSLAVAVMNAFKTKFNDHAKLDEYSMSISSFYFNTPVQRITEFCLLNVANKAYETRGPYTLFADLHLIMDSIVPTVRLEASLTSEDGASSTNPLNYTGGITARPVTSRPQELSTLVLPNTGTFTKFDRQMVLLGSNSLEIFNSDNEVILSRPRSTTSLPAAIWAFNNIVKGFQWHIQSYFGAHQINDPTIINYSIYAILPLSTAIDKVNAFKIILNNHIESDYYHYHVSQGISTPDATDEESLIVLIEAMQQICIDHFKKIGPHRAPTLRIIAAPIHDTVIMDTDFIVDGEDYTVTGTSQNKYHDNNAGELVPDNPGSQVIRVGRYYYNTFDINIEFAGIASRPSVASAIPKLALVFAGEGLKFETDTVEVFFSKPMERSPIDSTNLPISGGSISAGEVIWADQYRASIQVQNMENIAYVVTANNIYDVAGNLII
jgi:hypothetical protein